MSEMREPLRRMFDTAAGLYDAARPSYPDELFDYSSSPLRSSRATGSSRSAARTARRPDQMLKRGFSVVCVEMGASSPDGREQSRRVASRDRRCPVRRLGRRAAHPPSSMPRPPGLDPPGSAHRKAIGCSARKVTWRFWRALHAFPRGFDHLLLRDPGGYNAIGGATRARAAAYAGGGSRLGAEIEASGSLGCRGQALRLGDLDSGPGVHRAT